MTGHEIRRSFLQYFERHQHRIVPSSSLVPHDDPTLLFTNAGMNQFKDVFLGREKRDYTRAASAQKCMRVSGKHNDLDNVGPSFRHHTFFEMLGNFSFGDYFKKEAIPFAWTLLTEEWTLPAERLFATVFRGEAGVARDDEAYDIWRQCLPAERIGELGTADNFWQMGETGPCGRCSEIYYYRGADIPCAVEGAGQACRALECSCDRFVEIWNNVFMEFNRQSDGTLNPLPAPSIDTGMGLERVTAVLQGKLSNYDTDLFAPLLAAIGDRAGATHRGTLEPNDVSMRVVADHLRAMTFLIADGVVPSNEWRGYVLRKIMRRAMRHGKRLGITEPSLHTLAGVVVREFGDAYPELKSGRDAIAQVIRSEEERFDAVLTTGLPKLEALLAVAEADGTPLRGEDIFKLYDSLGMPFDFIEDIAASRYIPVDRQGFDQLMARQRERARERSSFRSLDSDLQWDLSSELGDKLNGQEDRFVGYKLTKTNTHVIAVFDDTGEEMPFLDTNDEGFIALAETPFYMEGGGQVSDTGSIHTDTDGARVLSVLKLKSRNWPRLHRVRVDHGKLHEGQAVVAEVREDTRAATQRNHTATHLLHSALRRVLGSHVRQAGSLVAPDRLRFDFVHSSALSREQWFEIEQIVNQQVLKNIPVDNEEKNTQEAIAAGAMALFGEKYGEKVRVVSIPGFSVELCGGTHVRATGDIGLFAIVSEGGVAAGVRRIEAITGLDSLKAFQRDRDQLGELAAALNARPGEVTARLAAIQEDNRRIQRELQQARMKAAMGGGAQQDEAVDVAGAKLVAREVSGLDKDGLRALVDRYRDQIKSGVVVLASPSEGKVFIVVGVTPDLTRKVPAGQVVKQLAPIVGGGGGGRPDFAEAGGKDPSKIGEMLAASRGVIEELLKVH